MSLLVLENVTKVLLEGVPDQGEVLGDVIDHGAKARETGSNDSFVMEDDELDAGLLQLTEEDLTGMLNQRNHQLQGPGHVADDLVVALRLTSDIQVRLKSLHVLDQQLGTCLGKQVTRGQTRDNTSTLTNGG